MKKTHQTIISIFSFIIILALAGSVSAQVCTGDYTIDNINTSGDIAALSGCTSIEGSLTIENTALTSLSGLDSLTYVQYNLYILSNTALLMK